MTDACPPEPFQWDGECRKAKLCARCKQEKPISDFNRNRANRDGLQSRCKTCHVISNREWANRRPEVRRATLRRQYQAELKHGYRRSKLANKEQRRAHGLVQQAVKTGVLIRPERCEHCDCSKKLQAHHHDYSKPLDVQWLCPPCHGIVHNRITL